MRWHAIEATLLTLPALVVVGVLAYDGWARWQAARARWQAAREWARLKRDRRDVDARLAERLREIDEGRRG